MHLDMEAYIALGFLVGILAVTAGVFGFILTRKSGR
jgi:hypothetical protein